MSFIELFVLSAGLAMDAFAVAISKGLSIKKFALKNALIVGLYFGIFQALMPYIGYLLGSQFESKIKAIDHWIAFILLVIIGGNMIREAFSDDTDEDHDSSLSFRSMFPLAIATSIDALAAGITFAFLQINIIYAITTIGLCTFIISVAGVKIGNVFGTKYSSKAELAGGIVLILIGIKILIEHLIS